MTRGSEHPEAISSDNVLAFRSRQTRCPPAEPEQRPPAGAASPGFDLEPDDRTDDEITSTFLCNAVDAADMVAHDLPCRVWSLMTFAEAEGKEQGGGTISTIFWAPGILSVVSNFGSLALSDHGLLKTPEIAADFVLDADDIAILGRSDAPFGPDVQATVRVLLAEADEALAADRRKDGEEIYRTLAWLASWDDLHDVTADTMMETAAGRARLRAFIRESAIYWGPAHLFDTGLLETEEQMCADWLGDWSVTLAVLRRWAAGITTTREGSRSPSS